MSTTRSRQLSYLGLAASILLTLACGALPTSDLESEATVTVVKQASPTSTTTATLSPAQATLTEYARQAE